MLAVRLPEKMETLLSVLAKKTRHSKSYHVKKALEQYLENIVEYEMAVAAHKEYLESGEKGYTLEEIKKEFGLK